MIKIGVISFPGTNCEEETVRVMKRNGMEAEVVLWNDPKMLDKSRLSEFDGYCIAGGFSYEDRGRSGVVAAGDPITDVLREEAKAGKVILGICNGAQILVETGLVPGYDNSEVAIALTWNEMKSDGELIGTGFYNSWVRLKNTAATGRSAFNDSEELMHIPMAHGEGRFLVSDEVLSKLKENDQIVYKYANEAGEVDPNFPHTPNGATESIAAICNPAGNVMAIMPHPERDPRGNGNEIFASMRRYIEAKKEIEAASLGDFTAMEKVVEKPSVDLEILVRLIIVDNAERTIETAIKKRGLNVGLERYKYYGITLKGQDPKEAVQKIMEEGELANLNKELVFVRLGDAIYKYTKETGLTPAELSLNHTVIASDDDDFVGESIKEAINHHAGDIVSDVRYGVLWNLKEADDNTVDQVVRTHVLYNPNSMTVTLG